MMLMIEPLIPALRRYACSLTRDPSSADDLTQDCLVRVISSWDQRRDEQHTRSWVFAILHNLAIDQIRRVRRRGPHVPIDDTDENAFAYASPQEEGLRHRDVMQALDSLPVEQRAVVLLVSVESMSYAETARVLNVPVGTVMSRLKRGRQRLRVALEGESNEDTVRGSHLRRIK